MIHQSTTQPDDLVVCRSYLHITEGYNSKELKPCPTRVSYDKSKGYIPRRFKLEDHLIDHRGQNVTIQRLMAGAGVGNLATQVTESWLQAHDTPSSKRQAAYLDKLRRLRDDLIHQENHVLTDALESIRYQTNLKEQVQNNIMRRSNPEPVLPETPSAHKQLQDEKIKAIEERRKEKKKPELDLKGKQVFKPSRTVTSPIDSPENQKLFMTRTKPEDIIINKQRALLAKEANLKDRKAVSSGVGDTSAKYSRHRLPPINSNGRFTGNNTFNKQMAMHKKSPSLPGVYQTTKTRRLVEHGRSASSKHFSFSPVVHGYETEGQVVVNNTETFEQYINKMIKHMEHEKKRYTKALKKRSNSLHRSYPSVSLNSSMSQGEYLNIVERENRPANFVSQRNSGTISPPPGTPVDSIAEMNEESHIGHDKQSCIFCENPDLSMDKVVITGKTVHTASNTTTPQVTPRSVSSVHPDLEPEVIHRKDHKQSEVLSLNINGAEVSGRKSDSKVKEMKFIRSLVDPVMPDINLLPPTPTPSVDVTENTKPQLQKTVVQNKLRKREVKNLLQDIKELNSITESSKLTNNANGEEKVM